MSLGELMEYELLGNPSQDWLIALIDFSWACDAEAGER